MPHPFQLVAGQGLGVSYSSLNQIGTVLSNTTLGQAKLDCYINIATGNLILKTPILPMIEMGNDLEFHYVYNSLVPNNNWRLGITKHWSRLPDTKLQNKAQTAVLVETDGHETIYELSTVNNLIYKAPGYSEGTPHLTYDYINEQWVWYHPGTHVTEYYNKDGYLLQRYDMQGRVTHYVYDQKNNLTSILAPSNYCYKILSIDSTVEIYLDYKNNGNDIKVSLQKYIFDKQQRLTTVILGDKSDYSVSYTYLLDNSNLISKISQTDGTEISFVYDNHATKRIQNILIGSNSNRCSINYNTASQVEFSDSLNIKTFYELDSQAHIIKIQQECGYDIASKNSDVTCYSYNATGQLSTIIRPDNGREIFTYNDIGLLESHILPEGQITEYNYPDGATLVERDKLNSVVKYINGVPLVTRYLYSSKKINSSTLWKYFLNYEISPSGIVTQYNADTLNNVAEKRVYLDNRFDISKISNAKQIIPLSEMDNWCALQNPQKISLTEFNYDQRGQLSILTQYATIDEYGDGVDGNNKTKQKTIFNEYGSLLQKITEQFINVSTTETTEYDCLQRIIRSTNQLNQVTSYGYTPAELTTIKPNARKEIISYDNQGLIASETKLVVDADNTQQQRKTTYQRDIAGRIVVTNQADGLILYTFYDRQQRLGYTVSSTGIVKEYQYDRTHNFNKVIKYANPIDVNQLYLTKIPNILPTATTLINLLSKAADSNLDRCNYKFFDKSNRLRYLIDGEKYITEFKYDELDRKITKIQYAAALTEDQLQSLKAGVDINLQINTHYDRCWNFYYDNDNNKIGEQDPAGYVTEHRYSNTGFIIETIHYANNTLHSPDWLVIKSTINLGLDAHTYFYRDAKGQCLTEINPLQYISKYEYSSNGLLVKTSRYANQLTINNDINTALSEIVPSDEDKHTTYEYDALDRQISVISSNNEQIRTEYDAMGHIILQETYDSSINIDTTINSDQRRRIQTRIDGWEQIIANANPYTAENLLKIALDSSLTEAQKTAAEYQQWQDKSNRNIYDDKTGLKLKSYDANNNVTYYYYDQERRLQFVIDPTGAIQQTIFNTFNEIETSYYYMQRLSTNNLRGGFINDDFQALVNSVKNPIQDIVTNNSYNKNGLIIQTIDPEQYLFKKSYNAFGEVVTELKPTNAKLPNLQISYQYEARGLLTQIVTSAMALRIEKSYEYVNCFGKETKHVDEHGNIYLTSYDLLGRIDKKTNPLKAEENYLYDAFNRVINEIDALGQRTQHQYNQQNKSHTIKYPITNSFSTSINNIFGEEIRRNDALGNFEEWKHDAAGKTIYYKNKLGHVVIDDFDTTACHVKHIDANNIITQYTCNGAGQIIQQVDDINGLQLLTKFVTDALGRIKEKTDPRNIKTQFTYDKRNLKIETIVDPGNLQLLTRTNYDGLGTLLSSMLGDYNNPNQFYTTYQLDDLSRTIANTIDPITDEYPNALSITTQLHLDASSKIIAKLDPNNNITRFFYDVIGQKRFEIDANGRVTEWQYNNVGKLILQRDYQQAINTQLLTDSTSLNELSDQIKLDSLDFTIWYFYDLNNQEIFQVNGLGVVQQIYYDLVGQSVQQTCYAATIDNNSLANLTVLQLENWVTNNANALLDRTTYKIRDEQGQERFIINNLRFDIADTKSQGIVVEQRYDSLGHMIMHIEYATPVTNPSDIVKLPADQVLDKIQINPLLDRVNYYVFDNLGRALYSIDAEACVTKFEHDENDNLIAETKFYQAMLVPSGYADLLALLSELKPSANARDRITLSVYDNANRLIKKTDALNNSDQYKLDALGQTLEYIDRGGARWGQTFDRSKRLQTEVSPATTITEVQFSLNNEINRLSYTQVEKNIVKRFIYDKAGNQIKIIEADGTIDSRSMQAEFDACNQLISTTILSIYVDDSSKPANFTVRPELQMAITTSINFDAKQQKVSQKNEQGQWNFYVYDMRGRLVYEINSIKAVTKREYDNFGYVIKKIRYATLLDINLGGYIKTGVPKEVIEINLKTSPYDRIKTVTRDQLGRAIAVNRASNFWYISNGINSKFSSDSIQRKYKFDSFGQLIYYADLFDPTLNIWAETIKWYNKTGQLLAESDPIYRITRYKRNTFGEEIAKHECALPPTKNPYYGMSLLELDNALQVSTTDRKYTASYDRLGQKISDTQLNVVTQAIQRDSTTNTPNLINLPAQNLSKYYQYSAVQKLIALTYEDGATAYTYYDARGFKIAETAVPRLSQDQQGNNVTKIPLTYYGINAFGQLAMTLLFAQGTVQANTSILPEPIARDDWDQCTLTQYDQRGLAIYQQDPREKLHYVTYTANRKKAREWYAISQWQPTGNHVICIDERCYTYDEADRPKVFSILRNHSIIQSTYSRYNSFNELIEEGPNNIDWPVKKYYDNVGRVWKSNYQNGIWTLYLYDLLSNETARIQSPTQPLEQVEYNGLSELTNKSITGYERTETIRDLVGRPVLKTSPAYQQTINSQATYLPISIEIVKSTNSNLILAKWIRPQETRVSPIFKIWPVMNQNIRTELNVNLDNNLWYVDLSGLVTDIYGYSINYCRTDPETGLVITDQVIYQSKGTLQFNNDKAQNSLTLVAEVINDFTVKLTGDTKAITAVKLWPAGDIDATEILVNENNLTLDLSDFPAGVYKITRSDRKIDLEKVPSFTIYTDLSNASHPLSKCISALFTLRTSGIYGELK